MRIDEALKLAQTIIDKYGRDADKPSVHLARFILDTFGTPFPCGWPKPRVDTDATDPNIKPLIVTDMGLMSPDEALGIAAAMIRAALEAKEQSHG